MDTFYSVLIGVASGVTSSMIFLWVTFFYLRPKIEISPNIAVSAAGEEKPYLEIKFINKAKRSLNDVKFEILKSEMKNIEGGPLILHQEIHEKSIPQICGFNINDQNAQYAFRYKLYIDLNTIWPSDDNCFITIMVHGKDEISGFSKTFRKEIRKKTASVKVGSHAFGNSFDVCV